MTRNRTATRIGLLVGAVLLLGSLSAVAIAQTGGPSGGGTPTLAPSTSQPGDDDGTADQGPGDLGTEATDAPSPSDTSSSSSSSTPSDDPSGDDSDDNIGPGNMDDDSDDNSGPGNMDDDSDHGDDHGHDGGDDAHGHDDDDGTVDQGHGDR